MYIHPSQPTVASSSRSPPADENPISSESSSTSRLSVINEDPPQYRKCSVPDLSSSLNIAKSRKPHDPRKSKSAYWSKTTTVLPPSPPRRHSMGNLPRSKSESLLPASRTASRKNSQERTFVPQELPGTTTSDYARFLVNKVSIKHALQSEEDLGNFLMDFNRWKEETNRVLGGDGYLTVDVSGVSCGVCEAAVLRERSRAFARWAFRKVKDVFRSPKEEHSPSRGKCVTFTSHNERYLRRASYIRLTSPNSPISTDSLAPAIMVIRNVSPALEGIQVDIRVPTDQTTTTIRSAPPTAASNYSSSQTSLSYRHTNPVRPSSRLSERPISMFGDTPTRFVTPGADSLRSPSPTNPRSSFSDHEFRLLRRKECSRIAHCFRLLESMLPEERRLKIIGLEFHGGLGGRLRKEWELKRRGWWIGGRAGRMG
ncbi:hypothetical protein HYFRA_00013913 [Hymenoscyphus fraxineus]|uniref:Uncharacterized protein n=1 Tax=Hymenoscyphus fraxineus TaxID=746836 RepID=A0A9N9PVK5_9HELO|nr:hypothetical protein HYFRA_00013913 [Hymenoscyphus fraxineus]